MKRVLSVILCFLMISMMSGCCLMAMERVVKTDEIIYAPNLIGQVYNENIAYDDVVIEISGKRYSDEYAKGEIMDQHPKPDKKMDKGDTVRVTISLGPRPEEKVMTDLSLVPEVQAKAFLDGLLLDLVVLTKMESSSTVEKGCVIRTDPVEGERLERGQTVILWISTGAQTVVANLPNVVGQMKEAALNTLEDNGFQNVVVEGIESEEPAGMVLEQSPPEGLKCDLNTTITLTVSLGSSITVEPPADESFREQTITLVLPSVTEDCTLTIWRDQNKVAERPVYAGTVSVEVKLWGNGNMTFTAKLSDTAGTAWRFAVFFDTTEPEL